MRKPNGYHQKECNGWIRKGSKKEFVKVEVEHVNIIMHVSTNVCHVCMLEFAGK